jgi:hypothetical protein
MISDFLFHSYIQYGYQANWVFCSAEISNVYLSETTYFIELLHNRCSTWLLIISPKVVQTSVKIVNGRLSFKFQNGRFDDASTS